MNFGNILGKVKDAAGNVGDVQKLVDQLPSNIKSKVEPLVKKFAGGDVEAASKAVKVLEQYKDNDVAKQIISKLKG